MPRPGDRLNGGEVRLRAAAAFALLAPTRVARAQRRVRTRVSRANELRMRGLYAEAEQVCLATLNDAEAVLGPEDPTLIPLLNVLGIVYKYTARFDAAERLYRRALLLAESQQPTDLNQLADLHHNLGGLDHARGRFAEGQPAARRAVELRTKALGDEHPAVAADRVALAALLDQLDQSEEAEKLLREAIRVLERTVGRQHVDVAAAVNNLAAICQKRGSTTEAEQLYRRALDIKERAGGSHHPELTPTLNNLAILLRRQGRTEEAAILYRRALAILERVVGPDHPNLLACRENYAALLRTSTVAVEEPRGLLARRRTVRT
jgi:tetratricopeptide (TPR) repeat protein